MKHTVYIKIALLFIFIYITAYGVIMFNKHALWGSDILHIIGVAQNINFSSPYTKSGYPLGFPILLNMEALLSSQSLYSTAYLHIWLFFIFQSFLFYLLVYKIFNNHFISILSSFIFLSVYPTAIVMSPQFGQEVNIAIVLFLSALITLIIYEKNKNILFLFEFVFLSAPIFIVHRSSSIILVIFIIFTMIILFFRQMKTNEKNQKHIILLISILIFTTVVLFTGLYLMKIENHSHFLESIILTHATSLAQLPASYNGGYFMNYVGWELLIPFSVSFILFIKNWRWLPVSFLGAYVTIILLVILYVFGYSILSSTIMLRASDYSLFFIALSTAFFLYLFFHKGLQDRKLFWMGYTAIAGSMLLYPLDPAIEKYIYRAVTGTTSERINNIPIMGGSHALYFIYGFLLLVIIITVIIILLSTKHKFKNKYLNMILNKKTVMVAVIVIFLLPRILLGIGGFYIRPPAITYSQQNVIQYIHAKLPNSIVISDPMTLYLSVLMGLHTQFVFGNKTYRNIMYLYGPGPNGSRVSNIAITINKWIKNRDVSWMYKFMIKSNITTLILDINMGKIVDWDKNPPRGGFTTAPVTMLAFKKAVDQSGLFTHIYSQNYGDEIFVYAIDTTSGAA